MTRRCHSPILLTLLALIFVLRAFAADRTVDRAMVETARELHFLRQHRIEGMFKAGRDSRTLFTAIGRNIGVSYDELLHFTFQELQASLTRGAPAVPLTLVQERLRGFGVLIEEGVARIRRRS